MFRRTIGTAALSLAIVFGAAGLAAAEPTTVSAAAASQLPGEVASFRSSMTTQLNSYFTEYGDRLSSTERQQMNALRAQIDRELLALQAKTQITARLAAAQAPPVKRQVAAQAAARAFDSAYASAMAGLDRVQPILQPKLSLFEAFGAKSDLDDQLSQFEALGQHIHQIAGT